MARLGAVVHTVDRESLARALDRAGREGGRPVDVLVQVDLGGAAGELAARGGAAPGDVPALADARRRVRRACGCAGSWPSRPAGRTRRPAFERLAALAERVRADHPRPWSCRRA